MRAHTEGKYEIGKRFAIVIGVATAGMMALGAQTAAGVVKYDTELTILSDGGGYGGEVHSEVTKCERQRRVVLFKKRPGADRKLDDARSHFVVDPGFSGYLWEIGTEVFSELHRGDRVYAKVRRKVHDRYVCRADRSPTTVANPGPHNK